jgi:hypothetical protein
LEDEIFSRARLAHPLGVAGGQVVVLDKLGTVVESVTLTEAHRVAGSGQDGIYEIRMAVPLLGIGGTHWLTWRGIGADGGVGELAMAGTVELPDRSLLDARLPALARFEVSPQRVDLLAGPAEVSLRITGNDDRAGLSAEVIISDSRGVELGREIVNCPDAWMDCEVVMELPQVMAVGKSAAAEVTLILRDAAGREVIYGGEQESEWPDSEAATLWIAVEEPHFVDHWRETWDLNGHFSGDPDADADGWSDLMEYALGTDPRVSAGRDPFATELPRFIIYEDIFGASGLERALRLDFHHAPWFAMQDDGLLAGDWELCAEQSGDLLNWEPATFFSTTNTGNGIGSSSVSQKTIGHWMRLRVKRP